MVRGEAAAAAAGAPDLVTELAVPIVAGRVHGVVLNPSPRQLTNDGQVGVITVRLEDQNRNLVAGDAVTIDASAGTVGPVQARPNGEWVAMLAPPVGMRPGPIRVTATTSDGQFSASTDLAVVNRAADWTLGARGGAILGHGRPVPFLGGLWERKTPIKGLIPVDASLPTASVRGGSHHWRTVEMRVRLPHRCRRGPRSGEQRWPFWVGEAACGRSLRPPDLAGGAVSARMGLAAAGADSFGGRHASVGGEAFTELNIYSCRPQRPPGGAVLSAVWWVPSDTSYCTDRCARSSSHFMLLAAAGCQNRWCRWSTRSDPTGDTTLRTR